MNILFFRFKRKLATVFESKNSSEMSLFKFLDIEQMKVFNMKTKKEKNKIVLEQVLADERKLEKKKITENQKRFGQIDLQTQKEKEIKETVVSNKKTSKVESKRELAIQRNDEKKKSKIDDGEKSNRNKKPNMTKDKSKRKTKNKEFTKKVDNENNGRDNENKNIEFDDLNINEEVGREMAIQKNDGKKTKSELVEGSVAKHVE